LRCDASYRQRAHELVAKAHDARLRTPETAQHFAWFLLTCVETSFRDPARALELAKAVVKDAPERGSVWLTLALAHYRNGNWQAADDAAQKSIKLTRDGETKTYNELLLAMICFQQGRADEARQIRDKARAWIAANRADDADLLRLATEAADLTL
jgi:tetratricopeptide (TPR) repeat protein